MTKTAHKTAKHSGNGPKFVSYFNPLLQALHRLGGSARPNEATDEVARILKISDTEREERLEGGQSRFNNAVAWARFYLAKAGYIDASKHGVWRLTDMGRAQKEFTQEQAVSISKSIQSAIATAGKTSATNPETSAPYADTNIVTSHREKVLNILRAISPDGFERFCQELLREAGFQQVKVTGKSGDEGIDGVGILQINPLVSFKVIFQCKRYKDVVGSPHIRNFRGAMAGRADKAIMITTGTFSADARQEAVRDGAAQIELIDGEKLVTMMESLEFGLTPTRTFSINSDFFDDFGFEGKPTK